LIILGGFNCVFVTCRLWLVSRSFRKCLRISWHVPIYTRSKVSLQSREVCRMVLQLWPAWVSHSRHAILVVRRNGWNSLLFSRHFATVRGQIPRFSVELVLLRTYAP